MDARRICAWTIEALHEAVPYRIGTDSEHDWNAARGALRRSGGSDVARSRNHGNVHRCQLLRHRRQEAVVTLAPTVLDAHIPAFDEPRFCEPLPESHSQEGVGLGRDRVEKADKRHGRLRERLTRNERRSTEEGKELSPL